MKTATRAVVIKNTGIDDLLSKFLVYFDASRNLTLATSTNISQWVDRISGLVASQATTSAQPLVSFRNGQTYVDIANANTRFLGVSIPTPLNINTSRAYFCFSNCVVVCTVNIPNSVTNFVIGRYGNLLSAIIIFNGVPTAEEDLRITEFLKRRLVYNFQGLLSFFRQDVTNGLIQRVVQISDVVFSGITNFQQAWVGCSSLTSFPLINTSSGTNFEQAWAFCSSLTSFPLINTSSGTSFGAAWLGCSSLTSFPLINTSSGTNFQQAWLGCSSLTSFPLINTSSGTNFQQAWAFCSSLTSFPLINTSSGTNFQQAWQSCTSLTSFPLINTSSGTNFQQAWRICSSLTSFPLINTSSGTSFYEAWAFCSSLTSFPANFFNNWVGNPVANCFLNTWLNCTKLTAQSVENILVSINFSGKSAPAGATGTQADITISYATSIGTLSEATTTAITNLKSRGWKPSINGVYV
jgi:hypothetical protein